MIAITKQHLYKVDSDGALWRDGKALTPEPPNAAKLGPIVGLAACSGEGFFAADSVALEYASGVTAVLRPGLPIWKVGP